MEKKEMLLDLLEAEDDFLSGQELAHRLGMTRAGVWKLIQALKDEGYALEAQTNRGYRLCRPVDVLSAREIARQLGKDAARFSLRVLASCGSTNAELKREAADLPDGSVLVAGTQTAGRGRLGHSFYSPAGTGLYLSVLLRRSFAAAEAPLITAAAAVAVCRALQDIGIEAGIKWVNDIYVQGKKVCGILTEGGFGLETGRLEYAVVGIGINIAPPPGGFPPTLSSVAGALYQAPQAGARNRLAALLLRRLWEVYDNFDGREFVEAYRSLNFLVGKDIFVYAVGRQDREEAPDTGVAAEAVGIDDDCRLLVRYRTGKEEALSSGEVSVRPVQRDGD